MEEGDIFKTTIPLKYAKNGSDEIQPNNVEDKILKYIAEHNFASASELQNFLNLKSRTSVLRALSKLLSASKIKKSGSGKNTVYIQFT